LLEVARRCDDLKSALLASVSHDLRTPLATIRAAAGSLADTEMQWEEGERVQAARQIDVEAERLNRIVGNLLDMGRIQGGALQAELEVLPVGDALAGAIERSRSATGERPVRFDLDPDLAPVMADPLMLDEAISNLLENVGRHTPPGTQAHVTARAGTAGRVILTVEDSGPGVSDADLDRIFERFYREPSATHRSGRGTGLGLAVVKGLVEAMGGHVTARRSSLGGLAVAVDLAAGAPLPEEADAPEDRQR
jgi:two-component system sensor histidine kinase KdpD